MVDLVFNVAGAAELNAGLKALEPRKQINAIRNAARAAMKPVKESAEDRVPQRGGSAMKKTYKGRYVAPGFASRNINIMTGVSRDKSRVYVSVGTKKEAFYVRAFLEKGVPSRHIAPQPWLRPAYEANKRRVERDFGFMLRSQILKQASKIKKPRGMTAAEARRVLGR